MASSSTVSRSWASSDVARRWSMPGASVSRQPGRLQVDAELGDQRHRAADHRRVRAAGGQLDQIRQVADLAEHQLHAVGEVDRRASSRCRSRGWLTGDRDRYVVGSSVVDVEARDLVAGIAGRGCTASASLGDRGLRSRRSPSASASDGAGIGDRSECGDQPVVRLGMARRLGRRAPGPPVESAADPEPGRRYRSPRRPAGRRTASRSARRRSRPPVRSRVRGSRPPVARSPCSSSRLDQAQRARPGARSRRRRPAR